MAAKGVQPATGANSDDVERARADRSATDWLPIEIWAMVAEASDRQGRAALAATCVALRDLALDHARMVVERARAAMDIMVDGWERHTAHWDSVWCQRDARGRCYACASMGGARSAARRRWISDCGTPSDPTATDLCDACASVIARDLKGWPMRRVDLDAPHVWSIGRAICDVLDVLPTGPIADGRFVVPVAATHLIDAHNAVAIGAWTPGEAEVGFAGLRPSRMPSVRAWLPLTLVRTDAHESAVCVCCDADSILWGTVAIVDWWPRASFVGWTCAGDSVRDMVMRRRRRSLSNVRSGRRHTRPAAVGIVERVLADSTRSVRPPHGA
ncbi:hypothetical protein pneo_cds_82 [Pandoravirus neocaledonia]|uniref:Uncharacterized protein n=1 Tax=Pandoravirus neocaledonia TaxID=2107708 RepID=A0A2U7UB70_9VIRU|nr:hypothetical protein pneo_cds_82 [Pandoravirus neocaledonia]AVK75689.1 hypothetical protein pneo_cds_82 [Pandoravirus neocaledonia]